MAWTPKASKLYLIGAGIIYLALGATGMIGLSLGPESGLAAVAPNGVFTFLIGVVMVLLGWLLPRISATEKPALVNIQPLR